MNYGPCEKCGDGPFSALDREDKRCGVAFAMMHRSDPGKQYNGEFCSRCVAKHDGVFLGTDGFDLMNKEHFTQLGYQVFDEIDRKHRAKSSGSSKARRAAKLGPWERR